MQILKSRFVSLRIMKKRQRKQKSSSRRIITTPSGALLSMAYIGLHSDRDKCQWHFGNATRVYIYGIYIWNANTMSIYIHIIIIMKIRESSDSLHKCCWCCENRSIFFFVGSKVDLFDIYAFGRPGISKIYFRFIGSLMQTSTSRDEVVPSICVANKY